MVYITEKAVSGYWFTYFPKLEILLKIPGEVPGIHYFLVNRKTHEVVRELFVEAFDEERKQMALNLDFDYDINHWKKFINEWCSELKEEES